MMTPQVIQKEGDSLVYLRVGDQWYYYDTNSTPLGKGAMGIVYIGYNCDTNERIAVKRVRNTYANNPIIRQRAKQEASLSFSHPNIVQMIGMCECQEDTGPIFILSNYVCGVTMSEHVKSQLNHLDRQERAVIISNEICSVLDALEYLHSFGITHRDIKPSNLMIENGFIVKLMDLGIAMMNGGNKYSTYGFIGTPQYAAPEQILRDSAGTEINATADLYSLGITYYTLLTGVNPMSSKVKSETLTNQVTKKLPYHKAIPRRLFKVIRKATEKDPAKRYQSAGDFKQAIQQALVSPDCSALRFWIEENKLLSIAILISFIVFVSGLIYLLLK